jgi:hypothetical protein
MGLLALTKASKPMCMPVRHVVCKPLPDVGVVKQWPQRMHPQAGLRHVVPMGDMEWGPVRHISEYNADQTYL